MASKTIQQILGYVSLTGMIQKIKTGIPDNLPAAFQTIEKKVLGDAGRYAQVVGTRQTSRLTMYGAPAAQRALKDIENVDVKLLHSYESIKMDPLLLQALRNYDNYDVQQMGIEEVARQQSEFRRYFDNLRLSAQYGMLANGSIWFDGNGNLLPSSSGAKVTVSFAVPSGNQNQLNVDGSGNVISSSWKLVNTDIPGQIRSLRIKAAQQHGYPLKYAFYGVNIPSYLTQNNYVIDYLSRNPNFAAKYLEMAEIPEGLFGLTWVPVYTSFFQDQNGNYQSFFGADEIVFAPEITRDVYELLQGSYMIPTQFNATADMAAALASLKQVWGMASYAVPSHNPPTAEMFYLDTFLPVWKVGIALYQATVVF